MKSGNSIMIENGELEKSIFKKLSDFIVTKIAGIFLKSKEKEVLRERIGKLAALVSNKVDQRHYDEIFVEMGRECCKKWKMQETATKFRKNPQEFILNIGKYTIWDDHATYDSEKGIISVIGKKRSDCVCPFAKAVGTATICDTCCAGFQKELFGSLFAKNVDVVVNESILKGNTRCSHTIYLNVN